MHGRLKVRTTDEEKRIKELERKKKLGFYRTTMALIMEKRKQQNLDSELLSLTAQLLGGNPDIYTLWNIRRETLLLLLKSEITDDTAAVGKLYNTELQLTENCLRVNPKSYCAWHHRVWVLENRTDADWKKELELCNLYLKLDERNFHTWDHRRYVISKFESSLDDEFDYTTEKIQDNFSNYSAWHYRSKILIRLHPDVDGGRPIEGTRHKEELEIVLSAAFTDPNDTSAWFYQRWLLGAVKKVTKIAVCKVTPSTTYVAFNNATSKTDVEKHLKLYVNGDEIIGTWTSCRHKSQDVLWLLTCDKICLGDNSILQIKYTNENGEQIVRCQKGDIDQYFGFEKVDFTRHYAEPVIEELNKQLDSCQQLLELEPDNKWTMLATTVLMRCLDSKKNYSKSINMIQELKKLDTMRIGYYDDLASLWTIENDLQNKENFLETCNINEINPQKNNNVKLTSLFHLQYWSICTEVDFSKNKLTSKCLPSLIILQNCKILNLCGNNITSMKQFPMLPKLQTLYLQGNSVDEEEIHLLKVRLNSVQNIIKVELRCTLSLEYAMIIQLYQAHATKRIKDMLIANKDKDTPMTLSRKILHNHHFYGKSH